MKTKIATSLLVILVSMSLIVGSTMAFFSDEHNSVSNTFSSGTLNMTINGQDGNVEGTWVSPVNWAPGEEVTGTLRFQNIGNVDVHHIWYDFTTAAGSDAAFMKNIIVTSIIENFDGKLTGNLATSLAPRVGLGDPELTLDELLSTQWVTNDDVSGTNDNVIAGSSTASDYSITFKFTFRDTAGNDMQGKQCGFSVKCRATQNSPIGSYVPLHQ